MTESFGRRAVRAALAALQAFCDELPSPGAEDRRLLLTLLVAEPLDQADEQRLRADAPRMAANYPKVDVEVSVPVPVNAAVTGADGFLPQVSWRDVLVPAAPPPQVGDVLQRQRRLLTFSYDDVRLPYLLIPGSQWIPVRRTDGRPYDVASDIVLPASLDAVSRAVLIELCLAEDGGLQLLRTTVEPMVTVSVDDVPFPAGGAALPASRTLPKSGRLGFDDGVRHTELRYALTPWSDGPLETGTGPTVGANPEPYRTVIEAGGRLGWLDVHPPKPHRAPVGKSYAVPAPRFRAGRTFVRAEVRYTTAVSSGGGLDGQEWHVKLYRTATPQHAAFLRTYFGAQADAVAGIIAAARGRQSRPPWGIAPVHVLDPSRYEVVAGVPARTQFGAEPPVEPPVDGRYGEWFGVPGGAPSDCFVVVCSPFIEVAPLPSFAEEPALITLPQFVRMAAALDACHERGFAHCDLKPDNVRRAGEDYVLVDADSMTALRSRPDHLPFTRPYARSAVLDWHSADPGARRPLTETEIRDHDRFGFAVLVLAGVAGTGFAASMLSGRPGERKVDSLTDLRKELRGHWGGGSRWDALVTVVLEPFDPAVTRSEAWTCRGWLARVRVAAADAERRDPGGDPQRQVPVYHGPFDREVADVRRALYDQTMGMPQKLGRVHEVLEERRKAVFDEAYRRYLLLVGGSGLVVFVLFLVVFLRNIVG